MDYTQDELIAIYELGRLYYGMGFLAAAERIFNGLSTIDGGVTPARIGLGLVKLEKGSFDDAMAHFRTAMKQGAFVAGAKLGLSAALLAQGDRARAQSVLKEVQQSFLKTPPADDSQTRLLESFLICCQS